MFGFLTPVGNKTTDPLTDAVTVKSFWRTLPRHDPTAAQKAVCEALSEHISRGDLDADRLRALLVLDRRARILINSLLINGEVPGDAQALPNANQWRQAAFELCWSFGRAFGQLLRSMGDNRFPGPRKYEPHVLLRLFQHRQLELLLRPFIDERSTRFSWKELHAAYRLAQSRGLLRDELPIHRSGAAGAVQTTLEREYVHALMQDFVNGGNFPPHDAFWISQRTARWCRAMTLEPQQGRVGKHRFFVDPQGEKGLVRSNLESRDAFLCLDMASFLESIGDEIASLRGARPTDGSALGRARRLTVLTKLNAVFAPEPPLIARRTEREPTASTVEVIVGMSRILRTLRKEADEVSAAVPRIAADIGEAKITEFGGATEDTTGENADGASTVTQLSTSAASMAPALLTMANRSDSGCRLHGPALATNPIVPGALIALRHDAASPWTLAVVRRVKKRLAGKRVEIGAEYLGKDPRCIVVVSDSDASAASTSGSVPPRLVVLFLPESATHPALPIKTLILPACGLAPGDRLCVRSRAGYSTIQLKEPLEEQADFIWSPFETLAASTSPSNDSLSNRLMEA